MAMKPRPAMPVRKAPMTTKPIYGKPVAPSKPVVPGSPDVTGKPVTKPIYGKPVAPKPNTPFKPVVSGASKNVGERFSFQQNANGDRFQKAPVAKAKGLNGQVVTSTAGQRAALPNRSRINALQKKLAGK